jgi:hypothetical protein
MKRSRFSEEQITRALIAFFFDLWCINLFCPERCPQISTRAKLGFFVRAIVNINRYNLIAGMFLVMTCLGALRATAQPTTNEQTSTIVVDSAQALSNAVGALATRGGTILLKSGTYDHIDIKNIGPSALLRIVASDLANPPLVRRILMVKSRNILIEGINFEPAGDEGKASYLMDIRESEGVILRRNHFQARTDLPELRVRATRLTKVSSVVVEDNTVDGLERGFVFAEATDIKVAHNRFKGITTDGLNFFECIGVSVSQNLFLSFNTDLGQHPDYVQFWTRRAKSPSKNIVIEYNVMLQENGTPVQGVFMDNDDKIPYENVTIRKNLIIQGAPHGITVEMGKNVEISDNLVASSSIATYNVAIRALKVESGKIIGNIATAVVLKDSPGVVSHNNSALPRQNRNFQKNLEERVLARLRGEGEGPVINNFRVLPEHIAAGPRRK